MRFVINMLLAAAGLAVVCGCGQTDLRAYSPSGTSAESILPSLSLYLTPYFVLDPEEAAESTRDPVPFYSDETFAFYSYVFLQYRTATPGFRSLCALVNGYFGNWERLVIIERFKYGGYIETGFIVAAVTPDGLMGVTNFNPEGPKDYLAGAGQWKVTLPPRVFPLDRAKFQSCLAELEKARKSRRGLWNEVLWFPAIDWPVYLLHDIKSDGSYLTLAVCAWGATLEEAERARLLKAPLDYAKAAELVEKSPPWCAIVEGSPAAKQLHWAGAAYASLIAFVWENTLGKPDYGLLGLDPLKEVPGKPTP